MKATLSSTGEQSDEVEVAVGVAVDTPKVAAVLATRFRARVELARRPELVDTPGVIVTGGKGGRSIVLEALPALRGVLPGTDLAAALSAGPGVIVLPADPDYYREAFQAMLAGIGQVADGIEPGELGVAYVGLRGLAPMYGGRAGLQAALLGSLSKVSQLGQGFQPRVGLAGGKFPAYAAGLCAGSGQAVQVGGDLDWSVVAGRFPIRRLPVSPTVRRQLTGLGCSNLGDLASWSPAALLARFGQAGGRLYDLAQGRDGEPLVPAALPEVITEGRELPFPSDNPELCCSVISTLLERLYARRERRGRAVAALTLSAVLDGNTGLGAAVSASNPRWEATLRFRQPAGTAQEAFIQIKRQWERLRPAGLLAEVTVTLISFAGAGGVQLGLLPDRRGDLARRVRGAERELRARYGGRPALHLVTVAGAGHPAPELRAAVLPVGDGGGGIDSDSLAVSAVLSVAGGGNRMPAEAPAPTGGVLQRAEAIEVQCGSQGWPLSVSFNNRRLSVLEVLDAWTFDLWWLQEPVARDYYRLGLGGGDGDVGDVVLEVKVYRDRETGAWFRQR